MRKVRKYAALSLGVVIILLLLFGCTRLFNRPPFAQFTANPTFGSAPLTVTFDASGSYDPDGTVVDYRWNFGDSQTGAGVHQTHIYTRSGTYTAELVVYDNKGATDSTTRTITVLKAAPKAVFVSSPSPARACSSIILNGTSSFDPDGYITSYNWTITNAELGYEATFSGTVIYWAPCWEGDYTVKLIVADNDGLQGTVSKPVHVEALPASSVHPGDILYHPAFYSQIATTGETQHEEGLATLVGHIGIVDCNFHVIEAEKGSGVINTETVQEFVNRYRGRSVPKVAVLRVTGIPVYVRKKAVKFARQQLGKAYDLSSIECWEKQIFGPSYYCSELAWAAYEVGSGAYMAPDGTVYCGYVNLDANDGSGCSDLLVTPNEIYDSNWTYLVGYLWPK